MQPYKSQLLESMNHLENMKCMCFLAGQQEEHEQEVEEEEEESDMMSEESHPPHIGEALARPSPPPESDGETSTPPHRWWRVVDVH